MLSELQGDGLKVRALPFLRQRIPLGILPTSAGYERREGTDYAWDGLRRGTTPFTIFQYTVNGVGHLVDGTQSYRVRSGEAMILTVPNAHLYWLEKGESWEFFWFSLTGGEAVRLYEEIRQRAGPVVKMTAAITDLMADTCRRLLTPDANTPFQASRLCYDATVALLEMALDLDDANNSAHSAISRVLAYVAAHPRRMLDVGRMAEVAGLSRAHFSRVFHAATGITPGEYLLREKIDHAARLLDEDRMLTIRQAAELTGFTDANYFSKAFRRVLGMTPSHYRTLGHHDDPARPR